ncbi:hypothetical protein [Arundinibacter roseus]|uniref:Glycosyl transferase n=1 Tax=Arundinibacter roseus TaxID=2070510 RepID=A0A4R4K9U3_9BACT|nr:hypothetical protein [Arundinibacter roseus]TDB64490.1 hypothetical protein EZE20_12495 [Arundinibacter roseus]
MKIVYTVCNRDQLAQALCLGKSVQEHAPEHQFVIGWADSAALPNLPTWAIGIDLLSSSFDRIRGQASTYLDFEFVTATRSFFAKEILQRFPACQELVFLAPSVLLFRSFTEISLSNYFLQLTPHRLSPIQKTGTVDDKRILNMGMFHHGSWILHPDGQEEKWLNWWNDRLLNRAHLNLCEGMCLDQLWLNYAPLYHANVTTVRNGGWHVGIHSLIDCTLTKDSTGYFLQNSPIISVDFAGLESFHPLWSDHHIENSAALIELRSMYKSVLLSNKSDNTFEVQRFGLASRNTNARPFRKRISGSVKNIIHAIEHFDWTHN